MALPLSSGIKELSRYKKICRNKIYLEQSTWHVYCYCIMLKNYDFPLFMNLGQRLLLNFHICVTNN